jgi:hypothetical protein
MKNSFLLIILLMISQGFVKAQTTATPAPASAPVSENPRGYIGISIGPSFPFSDFASKDFDNEQAGFAKNGFNGNISGAYRLGKRFGLAGMLFGTKNAFNESAFSAIVNYLDIQSTTWQSNGFMVGGYYSAGSSKTTFEMRLLIGYSNAKLPEIIANGYDQSGYPAQVKQESVEAGNLCSDLGFGLKTRLSQKMSFIGSLDFYSSEPEFANVRTYINNDLFSTDTFSEPINVINITIGVAFNLK